MATSTADKNFQAVKDSRFIQIRQPLSGYALGWKRQDCWRIQIKTGNKRFLSERTYPTEKSAKAAAKRLSSKIKKETND